MEYKAYINGQFISTSDILEIINPSDNSVAGIVPALTKEHINQAFESAHAAFKTWRNTSLKTRQDLILKFTDLMLKAKESLAKLMETEIAKNPKDGIVEIERTAHYIRQTIKEWDKISQSTIVAENKVASIHRVPLGVVLAISPFNYPVNLSLAKIIPALLTGNTVVFKPATNGSLIGAALVKLFDQAHFPRGVLNLITGRGRDIGDLLTTHHHIAMISFTGSVAVGLGIAKAQTMKPLVLELGGNDAAYVRYDADLTLAAKEVAKGAFSFAGQRCTAIKRVIVHQKVKAQFIELLLKEVGAVSNNPLVSPLAAAYVQELINDSRARGDKFLLQGPSKNNEVGFHIVETSPDSRAWLEEAFGPLLPIVTITSEDNLVALFNSSDFGLQNSLFTTDVKWAKTIALQLESGTVNINRSSSRGPDIFPFLGIKKSGFGTQGITDALISMTRVLNVVEND